METEYENASKDIQLLNNQVLELEEEKRQMEDTIKESEQLYDSLNRDFKLVIK